MVGGKHQDVRTGCGRLLYGDHIVPLPALAVRIGLEGDRIAHLLKPLFQILDGIRLPLGADGPVGGGQGIQVRPELFHIRQRGGPLQHHKGLRHGDGAGGRQLAGAPAIHQPRLDAPAHGRLGPARHSAGVLEAVQALARSCRRSGLPPEDGGKLLPGNRAVRLIPPAADSGDISLFCRPGHPVGIGAGHVREGAFL